MLYNCCVRIKFWIDFLYVFAVEAYTASWIEIIPCVQSCLPVLSRLIQPRGLKCIVGSLKDVRISRRGLYSLVDWNTHWRTVCSALPCRGLYSLVDWNLSSHFPQQLFWRRGLYSLVDWNIGNEEVYTKMKGRGLYSLVDWNMLFTVL